MQSIGESQLVRYLALEQKWGNLRFDFPSVNVEISHFGLSSLGHGARSSYGTKKLSVRSSRSRGLLLVPVWVVYGTQSFLYLYIVMKDFSLKRPYFLFSFRFLPVTIALPCS